MLRTSNINEKRTKITPETAKMFKNVARRLRSCSTGAVEAAKDSQGCLRELHRGPQRAPKTSPKRSLDTNTELRKNEKWNRAETAARAQFAMLNSVLARVSAQSRNVVFLDFCENRAETAARTP